MNKKLILTGILLVTILTGCADRDEEEVPVNKNEIGKIEKMNLKVSEEKVEDSIKTNDVINETKSFQSDSEVVDPTKPDKPW